MYDTELRKLHFTQDKSASMEMTISKSGPTSFSCVDCELKRKLNPHKGDSETGAITHSASSVVSHNHESASPEAECLQTNVGNCSENKIRTKVMVSYDNDAFRVRG